MSKSIYIFVHIPKSAGSSMWHSLAECAYRKSYCVDSHAAFANNKTDSKTEKDYIKQYISDYLNNKNHQNPLIIHSHYEFNNIDQLYDSIKYIVPMRNPKLRLLSAARWHEGINVDYALYNTIPSIFGLPNSSKLNKTQIGKIITWNIDDYQNKTGNVKYFLDKLNVYNEFKPQVYPHTISDKSILIDMNNYTDKLQLELEYFEYLQTNCPKY